MYLRHTTVKKDGKVHRYWRLVRSVRRGSKVVQEVVAQLGELDDEGRASARQLARSMTARDDDQRDFFEEDPKEEQRVEVRLDRLRVEHGRVFGNVWLGWRLWCALELDKCCERLMPRGREFVAWASMAALHVIARLCEPSSDLHIAEDWYRKTALEDILGAREEWVNDDRVYRALDALLPHKEKIEQHLKTRLGDLFKLDYDLLLYDVTSTYFEGEMATNPQAQRGYSRDNRSDCKQLCIALVVTKEGVPLGYEIFDGNRTDITTVEEIVSTMERRFGKSDRVWVMDRGMGSEDTRDRAHAHIMVCFLAHALWKTLELWQERAGLGNSPRTVLDELARIQTVDVIVPTTHDPARELRLRCVVRPDLAQQQLLDRLGLRLPERLRTPANWGQM